MSAKETLQTFISDFAKDIENVEPFNTKLIEFKLKLKSQIILILSQVSDQDIKEEQFKEMLEGVNGAIVEITKNINYENDKLLERHIAFFEAINEVLKEFLEVDSINDKHELSQLSNKISKINERMRLELKERKGGILSFIRKLIYRG
ncbi:MAG TPA: hypothetical protein EYP32_05560 [Aquificaceae bacterium]|nr:hypothetical protein [Aquificaceae bacterium]HIQ49208.1 hypothetical protein [Aquifex aeolicus]